MLVAASGNDTLWGGAGRDTFPITAFNAKGPIGADRIADFAAGVDRLDCTGFGLTFVTTLRAADTAAGLRLSFEGGRVTLTGVTLAQFREAHLVL